MDLNFMESVLYGLLSGLAEILPVSGSGHRVLLLRLFGEDTDSPLLRFLVHVAILAALYYCSKNQLLRLLRTMKLRRIPKKRRVRPLDVNTLTDIRLIKMALIPIVVSFFFFNKVQSLSQNLLYMAGLMLLNGIILYVPQFLPGSTKKSVDLSPLEGILLGLGSGLSVLPGVSCLGTTVSFATVRGCERSYALNTSILLCMPMTMGLILFDLIEIFSVGIGGLGFGMLVTYLVAAGCAFFGVWLGIKLLRGLLSSTDFSVFGLYSWGAALLAFILYITV